MCIHLGHCLHFASLAKINAYGKKFLQRSEVIEKFIPIYSCYNTFCTLSFITKTLLPWQDLTLVSVEVRATDF